MSTPDYSQRQQRMFFSFFLDRTEGDLELRAMTWNPDLGEHGKYEHSVSISSRDLTELVEFSSSQPGDIFMGVNPRQRGVTNACKSEILELTCIAVDVDFRSVPLEKFERALETFCFEPMLVVSSGRGRHVYWLMDRPIRRTDETQLLFERVSRAVAERFGGDHCFDITRVLRVPGRPNSKYRDTPMCQILSHHGPRYSVEQFERFLPADSRVSASFVAKPQVNVESGADVPARFWTLLKSDAKIRATWEGKRPDLKDKTRSGYDQSMSSRLARRGFTPAEIAAVLREMPSGKGCEADSAYINLTIGKAFARSTDARRTHPSEGRQSTQSTVSSVSGGLQAVESTADRYHGTLESGADEELAELCRQACKQSRDLAATGKEAGKWISPTFHFLRFLKSREEFSEMDEKQLRDSTVWSLTDFSAEEVFEACVQWMKIKPGFAKNRLFDALVLAQARPVKSCERWAELKSYSVFLSLAYHLQMLTGDGEIFLPCHTIAPLIKVTHEIVSRYRRMAMQDGFLVEITKATKLKATRFRVDLDKFSALETLQ